MKEFFTSQNIWRVTHNMLYYCEDRKHASVNVFVKPVSRTYTPNFRTLKMVFFKELCPWNEFESFVVFITNRLKDEITFFIGEFLEVFYFPGIFTSVIKHFWEGSILSKCFQSLGVKFIISLFVISWLTEEKSKFLSNIVEEIRPGFRNQ